MSCWYNTAFLVSNRPRTGVRSPFVAIPGALSRLLMRADVERCFGNWIFQWSKGISMW
jgi:hypothetical protein